MLGTDLVAGRTFNDLLDACIEASPDAVFVVRPERPDLTYAEFGRRRDAAAAALAARAVGAGDRVLIAMPTSVEQIVLMFGLYRLGAVAVITNPANAPRETAALIRRTRARLAVLGNGVDVSGIEQTGEPVQCVEVGSPEFATLLAGSAEEPPVATVHTEDLATVITTSGTSAEPKLVGYRHGNHVFAGESFRRNLSMSQRDTLMHHFPLFHMSGLGQLAAVLAAGARVLLIERFRSSTFADLVAGQEPSVTFLNSTHVKMIRESTPDVRGTSSLRLVVFALEMADEHYQWFAEAFGDVLRSAFGMTETVAGCIMNPLIGAKRQTCGMPVPGYRMRVVREDGTECAANEPGELLISCYSPYGLVDGYLDDPVATAEAFRDGWLYSGDIVLRDDDGHMVWLQRSQDVIKRAGENIAPAEVESVLESHPDVAEAGVVGKPDPLREQLPVAFVVVKPGHRLDVEHLRRHCASQLAPFKVPVEFSVVDALPKNSVGKLVRRELLEFGPHDAVGTGASA